MPLAELAAELRAEDSVISPHVTEPPPASEAALGALVAAGPAIEPDGSSYAAIFECVREGYLLHYGSPRVIDPPDPDLALLAGDYLYAKGLERLAALGDLAAVRELADLISLSAQRHADGEEGGGAPPEVGALWLASAVAIGTGPSDEHEAAKAALREQASAERLYEVAAETAAGAGLDVLLSRAAETVGFRPSHRG